MPTFTGYKQTGDILEIHIPVSDGLIQGACDRQAVAAMAKELAGQTAYDAVIELRDKADEEAGT